jgi:hypothetical protein
VDTATPARRAIEVTFAPHTRASTHAQMTPPAYARRENNRVGNST